MHFPDAEPNLNKIQEANRKIKHHIPTGLLIAEVDKPTQRLQRFHKLSAFVW